jgi:hypothetical protein
MEREDTSPWLGFRLAAGEVALLVDGELAPVVRDGDGDEDEVQTATASLNARTATSIASREGGGERLELGVGADDLQPSSIALICCS